MNHLSKQMMATLKAMQCAVDELLDYRVKLGQKVVVSDAHGLPKLVSAKTLVRQRKCAKRMLVAKAN